MVGTKAIALGLICVVLSVGLIGALIIVNQKDADLQMKNEQIFELENEQLSLETQVSGLQDDVSVLESQNILLSNQKSVLEGQVSSLQANVSSLESEVGLLEDSKSLLESQVSSLQAEVTELEGEVVQSYSLGYDEGESDGYAFGFDEGYFEGVEYLTQTGYYLRDPTYAEVVAFVNADTTDENQYDINNYVCYDFTADFNANATQAGYRCGFVYIEFSDSAHAISCFNTTDMGIIYVEPQNDDFVSITVGQRYLGDVIVDAGIIW
ncbi:MAG: hypothetical protein NWF06_00840 [Candidatus Bathyarchaeota archaeon]|nr:hypothetical protein [Candidatus Bathyarchaeum sp.]